ncbi:LDB19 domain-containing protein [Fusarium acuminatum]|uniref:LDB19 domain-containing protein n=1 Tax=Fusarium acuminatum TaxID=5515 RepID=A0ABZ2WXP1_9HYPO
MKLFPKQIRPRISGFPLSMTKSHKSQRESPASLECYMDSSPTIVLNQNHSSDGSDISGSLLLRITEDGIHVENLDAIVRIHATYRKPFKKGCRSCKYQTTELKRCQLVTTTTSLNRDTYSYPFSFQIPSYTPPTMDTPIVSVVYKVEAIASIRRQGPRSQPSENIASSRTIQVARSIPIPSTQAISNRIYQANGIEVSCRFNSVMNPTGKNKAILTMGGLRSYPGNGEDIQFWRVCKGTWILEETVETTAVACIEHAHGNGAERSTTRKKTKALGESSFYDGWATDDQAGSLSMEFPFSTRTRSMKFTQDTGDCGDTFITHALVLELQLMKETYPKGRSDLSVGTGVGKILRSEHRVVFSDYARLSSSGDAHEENLPCYHDLWPRPPIYKEEHVG